MLTEFRASHARFEEMMTQPSPPRGLHRRALLSTLFLTLFLVMGSHAVAQQDLTEPPQNLTEPQPQQNLTEPPPQQNLTEPPPLDGSTEAPLAADAGQAADRAVEAWLATEPPSFDALARLDAEELCRALPTLLADPAPPAGTEVRVEDRMERPSDDPDVRVFTYAAVRPGDQLDVVEVRVRRVPDGWVSDRVAFRSTTELSGMRAWLQTPAASWSFVGFTLLVLLLMVNRASLLRRWLATSGAALREHRRLVTGTLIVLYAIFGLGAWLGTTLPEGCDEAVLEVVNTAVTSLGATEAYGSGDVARAAVTTFYQNFVVVTLSVTFTLAALLGVPAYLFAAFSFFAQGIPFGLLGGGGLGEMVMVLVLLVVELTAYFLVVSGGGMLLATIWRKGLGALPLGFSKLLSMLPVAMLLLLAGAWYEAVVIILFGG